MFEVSLGISRSPNLFVVNFDVADLDQHLVHGHVFFSLENVLISWP